MQRLSPDSSTGLASSAAASCWSWMTVEAAASETNSSSEGEVLSLDGKLGRVYAGKLQVVIEKPTRFLP